MSAPETFDFLGLRFHSVTMRDVLQRLEDFIVLRKPCKCYTPTAELIVRAGKDDRLREIYNSTDLLTIDSHVVYYASRLFFKNCPEPVSAARIMLNFLPIAQKKGYRLYFLGASREVVEKAVENTLLKYPGINISGWHDGYFDFNNDAEIVNDIVSKKPDVLFLAMSSPLKENFVVKNIEKMNVPVSIGVGGTFDIIAGKCKLAPEWISKIGLEWFYRFIQEPRRMWKRYLITNTKFIILLIKEISGGNKNV